jgi:hypothetical protein
MVDGQDRAKQHRRLDRLDKELAAAPASVDLRYRRAGLLAALDRVDEAQRDYLAILAVASDHFGALNDLGTLLYRTGFRTAARTAYAEAVKHHPGEPVARINLANALLDAGAPDAAHEQYEAALRLAPDHPDAHQGMANLLQSVGREDEAEGHRQASYRRRAVTILPCRGAGRPCRILQLVSARGGNIPTRFLLDDRVFQTSILVVEAWKAGMALPPHDLIFNAIGDADLCASALDLAAAAISDSAAPVVNPPDRVRPSGRADTARRLAGLSGVVAPKIAVVPRDALTGQPPEAIAAASGLTYPLLVRSPGFHTGRYFSRVDDPAGMAAAVAALPGRELMLIQYLDASGADGRARKYRVMTIGGALFPLHLAVSTDWKVHYFTAEMATRPDHRAEEAAFLAAMPSVIGARAMAALADIGKTLALDYAGIDFGIGPGGDLLLFEANATMVVNPPDADPCWDYRRAPVARILAAVKELLIARARSGASAGGREKGA